MNERKESGKDERKEITSKKRIFFYSTISGIGGFLLGFLLKDCIGGKKIEEKVVVKTEEKTIEKPVFQERVVEKVVEKEKYKWGCPDKVSLPVWIDFIKVPPKLTNKRTIEFSFSSSLTPSCNVGDVEDVCPGEFSFSATADGEYTLNVFLEEGGTKCKMVVGSYSFILDTTPPETVLIPLNFKDTLVLEDTASFKISTNEKVSSTLCSFDGSPFFVCRERVTFSKLTDDFHFVKYYSIDLAGNEESPKEFKFRVDARYPQTKLISFPPQRTTSRTAIFEFEPSEKDVKFECDFDNQGWRRCESPLRLENIPLGKHILRVRAIDYVGKIEKEPVIFTWEVVREVGGE